MKNLTLIIFLVFPFRLFSQTDTPQVIDVFYDTTWNHHIMESDLILYVEIRQTLFVTQAGNFQGKILQVIKGEFTDSNFSINLDLIEFSKIRMEKRLGAICPSFDKRKLPYRCYAGFVKTGPFYDFITNPATKTRYYFFMSEKDLNEEMKNYFLQRFWKEKLWPIYLQLINL